MSIGATAEGIRESTHSMISTQIFILCMSLPTDGCYATSPLPLTL